MGTILLLLFWFSFCFIPASIAKERELGFAGGFFVSLFFSPLIGLIVALVSKKLPSRAELENALIRIRQLRKEDMISGDEFLRREQNIHAILKRRFGIQMQSSYDKITQG